MRCVVEFGNLVTTKRFVTCSKRLRNGETKSPFDFVFFFCRVRAGTNCAYPLSE